MRIRLAPPALLGLALVSAGPAPAATATDPAALPAVQVRDLHYGDVLFHFFQEQYFDAIVRAEAYPRQGRMKPHAADAELLLGGLYLSFGEHLRAADIFQRLLASSETPPGVRDRAWFYLGKLLYTRGRYADSALALGRAGDSLPPALAGERQLLLAEGMMHRGLYDEAVAALQDRSGPADWQAYARFNLGVALVRAGRQEPGFALLDEAGLAAAPTEEMRALRDKANVALGYAYLQAGRPGDAGQVLQRVRLNGPESSKALLAVGWADSEQGRFAEALVPWTELRNRRLLDAAVQESYLAVPYAYARLSADGQAAEYYEQAVAAYQHEIDRLKESIAAARDGRMLEAVLKSDSESGEGWFWQLTTLPDAPESRYLYHLLAGNQFQEALKDYRALNFLDANLSHWAGSLDVFSDMVATRRRAFDQHLPEAARQLAAVDIEAMDARRDSLQARFDTALHQQGDGSSLATAGELRTLSRIRGVEAELEARGSDPELADARDRLRLARGVMMWRLGAAARERAWRTGRELRRLDAQLSELRRLQGSVTTAMSVVPTQNDVFAARIEALAPRVESLRRRLADLRQRQGKYLASLAVRELESQQERLATYAVQARYSLAALYDRGTTAPVQREEDGQ